MKSKNIVSLVILLLMTLNSITFALIPRADQIPPAVSTIAERNDSVVLDGDVSEWSNDSLIYVDIFPQEPHDPPILVQITINFAYNDNYLFGFVFIPDTYGYVSAIELMFFGHSSQSGTADGVFINATENSYYDHGFDEVFKEPFSDTTMGGQNDVEAYSISRSGGAYFEFKKELNSGDQKGLDFNLYEGASIGVYIAAWIGTIEPYSPPNWGMLFTEDNWVRYIRLSIGYDNGEDIEVPQPPQEGPLGWIISDTIYQALYVSDAEAQFNLDGYNDEQMWQKASYYHVRQYLMTSDGYDPTVYFDGSIAIVYDDTYVYFYFEIYDETDDDGDFIVFLLSTDERMLEHLNSTDVVSMDTHGYTDMRFPDDATEPKPDIEFGGKSDGEAYVTYYNSMRHAEFRKELNSGDINGTDLAIVDPSLNAFIVIMTGYNAPPEGPNYGDIITDDQGKPLMQVHPIQFLPPGEQPTGIIGTETETKENTNTLVIGPSLSESIILSTFAIMIAIVVKRSLIKHKKR